MKHSSWFFVRIEHDIDGTHYVLGPGIVLIYGLVLGFCIGAIIGRW